MLVLEKSKDPWGDYLEMLGHYNPRTKVAELKVERIKHWMEKGAKPTDSAWNLLITNKVIEGKKRGVTTISKKRKQKLDKKAGGEKKEAAAPTA